MDGNSDRACCQARDRVQVLDGIVERSTLQQDFIDMRNRAAKKDRVAIRSGALALASREAHCRLFH
jgi:hypothetical protein